MRRLISMFLGVLLTVVMAMPAKAQVGLEEGTALTPAERFASALVFSSSVDTVAAGANDTTGVMRVADFTDGLVLVFNVTSSGTVRMAAHTEAGVTATGPWVSVATDSVTSTGVTSADITEFDTFRFPYVRVRIVAPGGGDPNASGTHFTGLYAVATKLYP